MIVTVLGIETVSYTSKKTNLPVKGVKVYYSSKLDPARGIGLKTDNVFVSQNIDFSAQIGDEIDILYNRFGSVEEVRLIEKQK